MQFVFNEKKSTQAAAYLLRLAGGQMHRLKLVKLMYVADRRALIEAGYPITGSRMISMECGPMLPDVLECVDRPLEGLWGGHIRSDEEHFSLVEPVGNDALSEYDEEILAAVFQELGGMGYSEHADARTARDFPEWTRPSPNPHEIKPETILRNEGWSEEEIEELARDVSAARSFHLQFA